MNSYEKTVKFLSDGASGIIGKSNGVADGFKSIEEFNGMTFFH
jgi:hypothetical protein